MTSKNQGNINPTFLVSSRDDKFVNGCDIMRKQIITSPPIIGRKTNAKRKFDIVSQQHSHCIQKWMDNVIWGSLKLVGDDRTFVWMHVLMRKIRFGEYIGHMIKDKYKENTGGNKDNIIMKKKMKKLKKKALCT